MSCWSIFLGKIVRVVLFVKSISKWKCVIFCYWYEDWLGWIECYCICFLVGWRWRIVVMRKRCWREWKLLGSFFFSFFLIWKGFKYDLLYWMVFCMFLWKDVGIFRFGGYLIFCRGLKRFFLLIRLKVLVRFMNVIYSVYFCF